MTEQERKALEALDKLYEENGDAMTKLAKDEYVEDPWNLRPRQPMIPVKKQND
jgi:enamine deaminase RidA (YjgF/YER057c/UK114 family)